MRPCGIALVLVLGSTGCRSSTPTNSPNELIDVAPIPGSGTNNPDCSWTQLGQNASHTGSACTPAVGFTHLLAVTQFDPFVEFEMLDAKALSGTAELLVHYQAPLVIGDDIYMETKSGTYNGSSDWNSQAWGEVYFHWKSGALVGGSYFESDWKPEPIALAKWEPLFHAAIDGNVLWVPGAGGTVYRVDRMSMLELSQVNPFGTSIDPNTFVSGPITIAPDGTVLYNAVHVAPDLSDVSGVLVRIETDGVTVHAVDYASLMVNPPSPKGSCLGAYSDDNTPAPWPPADRHRVSVPCGSLRPGLNIAPAVGADGTVFTVAAPNNAPNAGVLLALHADLTPKWSASLQEILHDGCGVLIPADAQTDGSLPDGGSNDSHCLVGAPHGVDPSTGQMPSVQLVDSSSSSPVVLPDGSVVYGGYNHYNNSRGHLVKFDATGKLLATYDDGWDQTPAVWVNRKSYSIIIKDNHYASWYNNAVGPYEITQVDADLQKQWSYASDNTYTCRPGVGTAFSCVSDHPSGFEWCVNAPAVDANGTVYANSEDGRVYAILQGGTVAQARFLGQSLSAAYTPVSVDGQGRVYTLNGGVMTVLGK